MPISNPLNKTNWCSRYRGPGWQIGAIRKPALCRSLLHSQNEEFEDEGDQGDHNEMKSVNIRGSIFLLSRSSLRWRWRTWGKDDLASGSVTSTGSPRPRSDNCVTRAPLLYFIRSWVALSFLCEWVSESGIGNNCPDLHFLHAKAWMSSTDPVSSITNCYRLIVSYTDPVHSFLIS